MAKLKHYRKVLWDLTSSQGAQAFIFNIYAHKR